MKTKSLVSLILVICLVFSVFALSTSAVGYLVLDSHLSISDKYLLGIPIDSTGAQLKPNFFTEPTGIEDNEICKSGQSIYTGNHELVIIVRGDVNGDGKVTSSDYLTVKKSFSGSVNLDEWQVYAADVSGDGTVGSVDYLRIKQYFAAKYDIYAGMRITPGYNITVRVEGTGGTVDMIPNALRINPETGKKLTSLKAGDTDIYAADGYVSLETLGIYDCEVVATFDDEVTGDDTTPYALTCTFYDSTAKVYGFNWRTADEGTPALKYISDPGHYAVQADFEYCKTVTAYAKEVAGAYKNTANIAGLEDGKTYYYFVTDLKTGESSAIHKITYNDPEKSGFTFFHMSDTQDESHNGTWWNKALTSAYTNYPNAAFTANTGDIVQYGGDDDLWRQMLGNTEDYTANNILVGVAGNHDYWTSLSYGLAGCMYGHFNVYAPDKQDTTYGVYYSFDYGDAHFTVIDTGDSMKTGDGVNSGRLTDAQLNWVKKDLAATKKTWKIVLLHNPLYSPGKYGADTSRNAVALNLQAQLNPVFAQYKVDLVLNGHDHCYSQSYPINGNGEKIKPYESETIGDIKYIKAGQGTVHLESATAGEQRRAALAYEFSEKRYMLQQDCVGYSAITVEKSKITVNFYEVNTSTDTDTVKYSWGIIK